jgi:hypothetical protein
MSKDATEKLVEESESGSSARYVYGAPTSRRLARLLEAFDARRRSRETLALRETMRALSRRS